MTKAETARREEVKTNAIAGLRATLPPGSTLYCYTFGWTRRGGVHVCALAVVNDEIHNVTDAVCDATGYKWYGDGSTLCSSPETLVRILDQLLWPDPSGSSPRNITAKII